MIYPYDIKVGNKISVETGIELCRYYKLDFLVERLQKHPERYKTFIFDGVSGFPESLAALLAGVNEKDLTYKCAMPHDLRFAYGQKGNNQEEYEANMDFYDNLIEVGVKPWKAYVALKIVELGGKEELGFGFSWAFASVG